MVVDGVVEIEDVVEFSREINKRMKFLNKFLKEVLDDSYWGFFLFFFIEFIEVFDNL